MHKELIKFFELYQAGFNAFDVQAIVSHFSVPATACGADGPYVQLYSSREELTATFESMCNSLRTAGFVRVDFSIGYINEMGDIGAVVDLSWRIQEAAGKRDFRATDMCLLDDGQWSIFSATAYPGPYYLNS
jgi:hypothetical protein